MFEDEYPHGYCGFVSLLLFSLPAANTNRVPGAPAIALATICALPGPEMLAFTTFMPIWPA